MTRRASDLPLLIVMTKRSYLRTLAQASICAVALACGSNTTTGNNVTGTPTPVLTTITVTLGQPSLTVGQTTTATARGLDQVGASIEVGPVAWTSSNQAVATVNTSGVVTAVGP